MLRRKELISIGIETIKITDAGYYELNGEIIQLPKENYSQVTLFTPKTLEFVSNVISAKLKNKKDLNNKPAYVVMNSDVLESAKNYDNPLVLNFASATNPGGNFWSGIRNQEESFCRNSTLYKSLCSAKAHDMYEYNRNNRELACCSNYMLLSKNVCVFRNSSCELLKNPYLVSIISIPGPYKNNFVSETKSTEIEILVKNKIRNLFNIAILYGYKTLILRVLDYIKNFTQDVIQYYFDVLYTEEYEKFFENIIFAISENEDKNEMFKQVFNQAQNIVFT